MNKNSLLTALGLVGLTAALAVAAPLPDAKQASPGELDALWAELYKDEPAASRAVLKLFKHPHEAVPFLKAKLRPLKLDAARCKQLLKDLGSKDERTWKAAWDELDYLDPRLAIDLPTLMNDVTESPARTRMVELCSQREADSLLGQDVQLRAVGNNGYNFMSKGAWWAEHLVERIGSSAWNPKRAWTRAARAVSVLEEIGSPDAVKALEQFAEGHADAFPTQAARESLKRLKK